MKTSQRVTLMEPPEATQATLLLYSYLSDSIGSKLAALKAG